jgi:ParB family chromosome partitioning protein
MSARQTLGRGFGSLIPEDLDRTILEEDKHRVQKVLIDDIKPNPDQPRREFDPAQLTDLSESIKQYGVLQPIILVRYEGSNDYKIIAGERRWRAAKAAKLTHIPAIIRSLEELEQIELSLIENIQRVDLSPLEQALAVFKLQQQFNLSLDQIAQKLGKASSTVSNLTRLLQLPEPAREALRQGKISEGHARAILALRGLEAKQAELLSSIINNKWTVRQAEEYVLKSRKASSLVDDPTREAIIGDLSAKLSTKVSIKQTAKGGQLIIPFKNQAQLSEIIKNLGE